MALAPAAARLRLPKLTKSNTVGSFQRHYFDTFLRTEIPHSKIRFQSLLQNNTISSVTQLQSLLVSRWSLRPFQIFRTSLLTIFVLCACQRCATSIFSAGYRLNISRVLHLFCVSFLSTSSSTIPFFSNVKFSCL